MGKRRMGKAAKLRVGAAVSYCRSETKKATASASQCLGVERSAVDTLGDTLNEALSKNKVLIVPTLARLPMRRDKLSNKEEVAKWRDDNFRVLILASMAGLPQVTMPVGALEDKDGKKVPVSLSLVSSR